MRKNSIFFMLIAFAIPQSLHTTNIISLFIRPYEDNQTPVKPLGYYTQHPGKLLGKIMKKNYLLNKSNQGIFATYYGYVAVSSFNGHIMFPRKQQKETLYLLVTQSIKPVMMTQATVHHFEIEPKVPHAYYKLERKQNTETKLYFWDCQQESFPSNNIIPLNCIVIFAQPKNIIVPEGITLTQKSPHFILPDIYAKKNINLAGRALWVLTMNHFFSPVKFLFKKETDTYYSKLLK